MLAPKVNSYASAPPLSKESKPEVIAPMFTKTTLNLSLEATEPPDSARI